MTIRFAYRRGSEVKVIERTVEGNPDRASQRNLGVAYERELGEGWRLDDIDVVPSTAEQENLAPESTTDAKNATIEDVPHWNVKGMTFRYRFVFQRRGSAAGLLNGQAVTVRERFRLPAPVSMRDAEVLGRKALARTLADNSESATEYELVSCTWDVVDFNPSAVRVWCRVHDDGDPLLQWIPGYLYDDNTVLTALGLMDQPDDVRKDLRMFSDLPFTL